MKRKPEPISDQLRRILRESDVSRYAISKATGIDQAVLSRFLAGTQGLSLETIDAIGHVLNIRLVVEATEKPTDRTPKPCKRGG